MYGLVKDHKETQPGSNIPKLREVVSGSDSNTEYISAYVDHHAKPEVVKLSSYLEDTPLPPGAIPVTMDVTALYPSVPQEEGLESFERAMEKRPDKSVPSSFLVKLMRLVLKMNSFIWDKKLYVQRMGTAIGTRSAPTFCGLFMGEFEEKMIEIWESIGTLNLCLETLVAHENKSV